LVERRLQILLGRSIAFVVSLLIRILRLRFDTGFEHNLDGLSAVVLGMRISDSGRASASQGKN